MSHVNHMSYSQIIGNLWVGSAPPIGLDLSKKFDCLVLAAFEYQPKNVFPNVEVIYAPIDDNIPTIDELGIVIRTAGRIITRLRNGKRVLVTCRMGLNRSAIMAAVAMCMGQHNLTPLQAVKLMRQARGPLALCNKHFVQFLNQFCK